MADFPTTRIENLEVSRLVMGTNWWLGYSHHSKPKDDLIKAMMSAEKIAAIIEVFLRAGVNVMIGPRPLPKLLDAMKSAEDRTGRGIVKIGTPGLNTGGTPAAYDENCRTLDDFAAIGIHVCMPHQCTTDALVDRTTRSIRQMDRIAAMIRERGMVPGLSNHAPEAPIYADETNLDVATYIQIYNAIGFLMQVEVDWVHRVIWKSRKPVLTIKPMAAGKLLPLPGLAFAWATIRDCDLVCVGTQTPDEARECIEISLSVLERRPSAVELQKTRSKASIET
jgi:hypothetical protein